jgi:hypothetical protein
MITRSVGYKKQGNSKRSFYDPKILDEAKDLQAHLQLDI